MRVLVVEDEPDLLRVLAQALREEGYAVDEAATGPEALFKATSWDYDAVLLDLMIPGLNGFEVLAKLRKQKPTPVLILTARNAVDDRHMQPLAGHQTQRACSGSISQQFHQAE